jgi:hypothetical protein
MTDESKARTAALDLALASAWDELLQASHNRDPEVVLRWLVEDCTQKVEGDLREAEDEVLRALHYRDVVPFSRHPRENADAAAAPDRRYQNAQQVLNAHRAQLAFLLALKEKLEDVSGNRFAEELKRSGFGRRKA